MIIRLVGLTFPSGQADITAARALLEKLQQAADVFPRSQIVIEGHTDAYGERRGEPRAVAQARRGDQRVSEGHARHAASRISAVGYGETQPIANNDTAQGRERNRRIDVIIEPQLDSSAPRASRQRGVRAIASKGARSAAPRDSRSVVRVQPKLLRK